MSKIIYMVDWDGVLYRINGYRNEIYNTGKDSWEPWEDEDIFYYHNHVDYLSEKEAKDYIRTFRMQYLAEG